MRINHETLIITDPCYVKSGNNFAIIKESTIYGDWSCMVYKGTKEEVKNLIEQWDEYYFDFFKKYNFSGLEDTEQKKLYSEFKEKKKQWLEEHCYGEFCADSGQVAVYKMSVIEKRCPEFLKWAEEHPWCVCFVPDYSGSVSYIVEETESGEKTAHIVGDNFYSTQSGF